MRGIWKNPGPPEIQSFSKFVRTCGSFEIFYVSVFMGFCALQVSGLLSNLFVSDPLYLYLGAGMQWFFPFQPEGACVPSSRTVLSRTVKKKWLNELANWSCAEPKNSALSWGLVLMDILY